MNPPKVYVFSASIAAIIATFSLQTLAGRISQEIPAGELPHLDLEMTGRDYLDYFRSHPEEAARIARTARNSREADPLETILRQGARNLAWLDALNSQRPVDRQIELWTPANTNGIPISTPSFANRDLVRQKCDAAVATLPKAFLDVVQGSSPVPSDLQGLAEADWTDASRKFDRCYQSASRWLLQEPYLFQYAALARNDVRGYWNFEQIPDAGAKLAKWSALSAAEQAQYSTWLLQMCANTGAGESACKRDLEKEKKTSDSAAKYYATYRAKVKPIWDAYFDIEKKRSDIRWTSQSPGFAAIPFLDPKNAPIQAWLKTNIEDEWKWNGWQLNLDFVSTGSGIPRIQFQAGATPHVNGVAGNIVTMDANAPIQQYSIRWTIRHEFGHVLGFPDCYLEFYDSNQGVMVNYQLDLDNLMCSRKGHLQDLHFQEMKKAYFKP